MDDARARKIKQVVANNFDQSFAAYEEFEEKHGFFADLTRALAEFAGLEKGMKVLDLGCGTGISSAVLAGEFGCRVTGIDLSAGMVEEGRKRISDPRVELLVGDACRPAAATGNRNFDAALYNASIFIIPEARQSLQAAVACLEAGGIIGFSFYPELVGADGQELFAEAFTRCDRPRPKKQTITGYNEALAGLESCCGAVREGEYSKPLSTAFLVDFFSIPAQSASLFPRLDYRERKTEVKKLFAALEPESESARIVWRLAAGRRPPAAR